MKIKVSKKWLKISIASVLSLFAICVFGQTKPYYNGVIRVKFKLSKENDLDHISPKYANNEWLESGITDLDELSRKYKVHSMKRVYPPAGKFELKHRKHQLHLWYELRFKGKEEVPIVVDNFKKLASIQNAEPCFKIRKIGKKIGATPPKPGAIPNDPQFTDQWHYKNTGQTGGTPGSDISLDLAWDKETGNPDVIVSVHDGGIDITHEDLTGQLWINTNEIPENGIDDDNNGYIDDYNGYNFGDGGGPIPADDHGTHVGGTIAAKTNNEIGVSGIAGGDNGEGGARLMSLSVFGAIGVDGFAPSYVYAADNGAVISQNSWGYTNPGVFEQVVLDGIDYFIENAGYDENESLIGPMAGGIVIFAAGNDNSESDYYPGYYPPVFAVAATNHKDEKSWYSNYGTWVDVSAPGGETMTLNQGVLSTTPNNSYSYFQGTSMACPHVSGLAALIVSKNIGTLTAGDVENIIVGTTDDIYGVPANSPFLGKLGSGRINALTPLLDDEGIPPSPISNLAVEDSTQNIISLKWTAPYDSDNGKASKYDLRYSKTLIDSANFENATPYTSTPTPSDSGKMDFVKVTGLEQSTLYYFAIKSYDLFGNKSKISNVAFGNTTDGPSIDVDPDSLSASVDVTLNPIETKKLTILNNGLGVLEYSSNITYLNSPISNKLNWQKYGKGKSITNLPKLTKLKNKIPVKSQAYKQYSNSEFDDSLSYDIGENADIYVGSGDLSAIGYSTKFIAPRKFVLTHVKNVFRTEDLVDAEIIVKIYLGGNEPSDGELLLTQTITHTSSEGEPFIDKLNYSLSFNEGETFWIHYYSPEGISYPIGIYEGTTSIPNTFYFSFDAGGLWHPLEDVFETDYYKIRALSKIENQYVSLSPSTGIIHGNSQSEVDVTFDGSELPNGLHKANIIINNNDANNPRISIPTEFLVSGQQPNIEVDKNLIEFGAVFIGAKKTSSFSILNTGYDDLIISSINLSDSSFGIKILQDSIIKPNKSINLEVFYTPQSTETKITTLSIGSNDPNSPTTEIILTGTGVAPPKIEADPLVSYDTLFSGDSTQRTITIKNTGDYPLTYSFPQLAAQKILSDPKTIKNDVSPINFLSSPKKGEKDTRIGHKVFLGAGEDLDFGYTWMDSDEPGGPSFVWNDISSIGVSVEGTLIDDSSIELAIPFEFPFYGNTYQKLFLNANGLLSFEPLNGFYYNNDQIPSELKPNNLIAFLWTDLIPILGKAYYLAENNKLTIQYDQIPHFDSEEPDQTITCQLILHYNGLIEMHYKEVNKFTELTNAQTIGIENSTGKDGIQVVFNNSYLKDSLALIFMPPGPNFITNVSKLNGLILPGNMDSVKVSISSEGINEGDYTNELVVQNNDPKNSAVPLQFNLNVIGEPSLVSKPAVLDFDSTFINTGKTLELLIKNQGTGSFNTTEFLSSNPEFVLEDSLPITLPPNTTNTLHIKYAPSDEGKDSDTIWIVNEKGTEYGIFVEGVGISPPRINVNPNSFNISLNAGDSTIDSLFISNSGGSNLYYSVSGTQWIKSNPPQIAKKYPASYYSPLKKEDKDHRTGNIVTFGAGNDSSFGYSWEDNQDGDGGMSYNWIEIKDIGEKLPILFDDSHRISLPFKFNFYGKDYDSISINANGMLSFDKINDLVDLTYFNLPIPNSQNPNAIIAPFWADIEPGLGNGVYYYGTSEYIVVQFDDAPHYELEEEGRMTYQAILYANGTIKFQYKDVDGATFNDLGTVGIENEDGLDGMEIAFNSQYIKNKLAITITPPVYGKVEPGETSAIPIEFVATDLFDGVYKHDLAIRNNDPLDTLVIVPVELTVAGIPDIATVDTIDFGEVFIQEDSSFIKSVDFYIHNEGTKNLDISQLLIVWTGNIDFSINPSTPTTIPSKDSSHFSLDFKPSEMGGRTALLIIQSNDPDQPNKIIALIGKGVSPPVFDLTLPQDSLYYNLKHKEDTTVSLAIGNTGGSKLIYTTNASRDWTTLSIDSGEIAPGNGHLLDLTIIPDGLTGGEYISTLSFKNNDPSNSLVQVPVNLYVNYAPIVVDGPGDSLSVNEGDSLFVEIVASDPDGTVSGFSYNGNNPHLHLNYVDSVANLVYLPSFDEAGPHGFDIEISDDRGDITIFPINVYVYNVNRSPKLTNPIPDQLLQPGGQSIDLNLSSHFIDPDQDSLTYNVIVSNGLSVSATLNGDSLNLTSNNIGETQIMVTAQDPDLANATDTFTLIVNGLNQPPVITNPITDKEFNQGDPTEFVILNSVFSDPDGDSLTFFTHAENSSVVLATISNGNLYLDPGNEGNTNVNVAANDGNGGIANLTFTVTVSSPNLAPELIHPFELHNNMRAGIPKTIDLANHFRDPENESLKYYAISSNKSVINANTNGSLLRINAFKKGKAIINVIASDPQNASIQESIAITASTGKYGDVVKDGNNTTKTHKLNENSFVGFPNPMKEETTLWYYLNEAGQVKLEIFNPLGQVISKLVEANQPKGFHNIEWKANGLSRGMYTARLISSEGVKTLRLLVK